MDIYAFQAHQVARPSLVDVIGWLWREAVCLLLGLVRAALHRTVTRPRHLYGLLADGQRPASGVDDRYAVELAAMRADIEATADFGLLCGVNDDSEPAPLTNWALDDTGVYTDFDRLDADATFPATRRRAVVRAVPDATEIAMTAAARQAGGAA